MTSWQLLMKEYMVCYDFIINFIVPPTEPTTPSPFTLTLTKINRGDHCSCIDLDLHARIEVVIMIVGFSILAHEALALLRAFQAGPVALTVIFPAG